MRKFPFIFLIIGSTLLFNACGADTNSSSTEPAAVEESKNTTEGTESYDPNRGEGKFNAENVKIGSGIDAKMASLGEAVSGTKCTSCHKLTDEKLVGPGWKGVTERRKPEWLMNFITNPDPMIDKDPAVQADLELCLVRMPNQSLSDDDARHIVEFMRKNDGIK
jgi:hypothetical protein